jgi:hypothetical protein
MTFDYLLVTTNLIFAVKELYLSLLSNFIYDELQLSFSIVYILNFN